ncbi:putative protein TPRXL isoform X1 [Brachypodium distachyon]|uniref:putative protein TPRXL isoform X1 n=1 Tax=Brachypodium distachyon TaxID=15368 RepID=UPI0001C738AA|nr:putative protein TPRXL isoform X1 [Brachypodium distachyon]|eukprot:XP_024316183.1 putative protein TPRXL isoform X1 [Brachypodium distachyon]
MASGGWRRRRGKAKRKTKYLSLSRHLNAMGVKEVKEEDGSTESMASPLLLEFSPSVSPVAAEEEGDGGGEEQQMEPFALHPEATLFAAAPSLTDILGAASPSSGGGGGSPPSCAPSPDAASGGFEGEEEEAENLARRALRGRERWVYCSRSTSSSSSPPTTTTSSSCSSAASTGAAAWSSSSSPPPRLKLDYDGILSAWNGRGSLYTAAAAAPKLEPELLDSVIKANRRKPHPPVWSSLLGRRCSSRRRAAVTLGMAVQVFVEVAPSAWSAPETERAAAARGRAERVRRYKEKRQARLFSKRIRYEVRRINAVRRPRFKGRFIKETELGTAAMAGANGGEFEPAAS